jgi:hypothetical protein
VKGTNHGSFKQQDVSEGSREEGWKKKWRDSGKSKPREKARAEEI